MLLLNEDFPEGTSGILKALIQGLLKFDQNERMGIGNN